MQSRKLVVAGIAALSFTLNAEASSNILFVLDSSNSMWGQVEGTAKLDIAKQSLSQLMSDVPADTQMGLLVYGHRDKESCEDIELLMPVGSMNAGSMNAGSIGSVLEPLRPTGKTPIAFALENAASAFDGLAGGSNSVVLVSDGIETCDGDPCEVAAKLAAANVAVKVHVIGFGISQEDRASLECIAEKGKGRYFPADSTEGFVEAVSEAVQVAQQEATPEPEPAPQPEPAPAPEPAAPQEPERTLYFEDNFSGEDISADWQLVNPDPNGYIVEDDALLVVNSKVAGFEAADTPNIVRLNKELPKGDWDLTATARLQMATGRDHFWLGLYGSEAEFLAARISDQFGSPTCGTYSVEVVKMSGTQRTNFETRAAGGGGCGGDDDFPAVVESLKTDGVQLTLSKRGRNYHATVTLNGIKDEQGQPRTVSTQPLTSLRSPGTPAMAVGKHQDISGDTTAFVDKIEIFSVIK